MSCFVHEGGCGFLRKPQSHRGPGACNIPFYNCAWIPPNIPDKFLVQARVRTPDWI